MLETYFSAPKTLERLRSGPSSAYIDGFAGWLEEAGYSHASAIRYLRAAAHLGHFLDYRGMTFADLDTQISETFRQHLSSCRCLSSNGGKRNHHTFFGVKRFHQYLMQLGVCPVIHLPSMSPAKRHFSPTFATGSRSIEALRSPLSVNIAEVRVNWSRHSAMIPNGGVPDMSGRSFSTAAVHAAPPRLRSG